MNCDYCGGKMKHESDSIEHILLNEYSECTRCGYIYRYDTGQHQMSFNDIWIVGYSHLTDSERMKIFHKKERRYAYWWPKIWFIVNPIVNTYRKLIGKYEYRTK